MSKPFRKIAVTGATGYIGQALLTTARASGLKVTALVRRAPKDADITWRPFDLGGSATPPDLDGADALIHLAADTASPSVLRGDQELDAARRLIVAAQMCGARIVFVSSQTARPDAPTEYGRRKWAIEREVLAAHGAVVRPGLVYGGEDKGLFGAMCRLIRILPVLPDFRPAAYVQPINVHDLADVLLRVAMSPHGAGSVFHIAQAEPISFTAFQGAVARHRIRRPRLFVPAPQVVIRAALRFMGDTLARRTGLDRLASLFELPTMNTAPDLSRLGLSLRPLAFGLARGIGSGCRRLLIEEGRALLTYILREEPKSSLVRRYVKAAECLWGEPMRPLPFVAMAWPAAIALLEKCGPLADELDWRVDVAIAIAEASPQGAVRFLRLSKPSGFLRASGALTVALLQEASWRIAGQITKPLFRNWTRQ